MYVYILCYFSDFFYCRLGVLDFGFVFFFGGICYYCRWYFKCGSYFGYVVFLDRFVVVECCGGKCCIVFGIIEFEYCGVECWSRRYGVIGVVCLFWCFEWNVMVKFELEGFVVVVGVEFVCCYLGIGF